MKTNDPSVNICIKIWYRIEDSMAVGIYIKIIMLLVLILLESNSQVGATRLAWTFKKIRTKVIRHKVGIYPLHMTAWAAGPTPGRSTSFQLFLFLTYYAGEVCPKSNKTRREGSLSNWDKIKVKLHARAFLVHARN